MAADTDSEMKNVTNIPDVQNYRNLVQTYLNLHLYEAALFWADKVVALTCGNPKDVYWLAQCMFKLKQYHRAVHLLKTRDLDKTYVLCNSLAVRCLLEMNELNEALKIINSMDLEVFLQNTSINPGSIFEPSLDNGMFDDTPRRQVQSSVLLLKGKVLEAMDNRGLASECYTQALKCDVHCYEAFQCLIQHSMLTAEEEQELIDSLPIDEQCTPEESEVLLLVYKSKLNKYCTPVSLSESKSSIDLENNFFTPDMKPENNVNNTNSVPHIMLSTPAGTEAKERKKVNLFNKCVEKAPCLSTEALERLNASLDLLVAKAERMYYDCDYQKCINLTTNVMKQDPYHNDCLPIHISCLVELQQSNKLFLLAHNLVDLYPNLAISWYAVGCYYYNIGKNDQARRYYAKATSLDRLFGPAWLAYGHSFAIENEHDQAMAAYFKATQLMKGCHLPLMYIGLECGLTNNVRLAEKFFMQAFSIAPEDPFVLHEMGIISFQNKDYSIAENHFRNALKIIKSRTKSLTPERWAPLYNNLGHSLRKQKKYKQALASHHEALLLIPQCASTYSAIAYVHVLMNDLEEGIDWFHKALSLKSDDTFSSTVLNYAIELISDEQPAYPGAPDFIPDFEKCEDSGTQQEEEPVVTPEASNQMSESGEMSMTLEMDISESSTTKD